MASEPRKPEHVREAAGVETREPRVNESAERGANQIRDAADQAGDVARDTSAQTREAAEQIGAEVRDTTRRGAAKAKEITSNIAETVQRTTDAAFEITQHAADQGREVVWQSVRAAAGVQGRLADVSYGRSHQLFGSTARMIEVYR